MVRTHPEHPRRPVGVTGFGSLLRHCGVNVEPSRLGETGHDPSRDSQARRIGGGPLGPRWAHRGPGYAGHARSKCRQAVIRDRPLLAVCASSRARQQADLVPERLVVRATAFRSRRELTHSARSGHSSCQPKRQVQTEADLRSASRSVSDQAAAAMFLDALSCIRNLDTLSQNSAGAVVMPSCACPGNASTHTSGNTAARASVT